MSQVLWLCLALLLTIVAGGWSEASDVPDRPPPNVRRSLKHDTSPPLRELQPAPPTGQPTYREIPRFRRPPRVNSQDHEVEGTSGDPATQDWHGSLNLTTPSQSFEGVSNADNAAVAGVQLLPPDTNGDVGPNHYVQWVNISLAVFSKTGAVLAGPVPGNALWSGFGGVCETTNQGDPIVLYDHLADRWFLSQFAFDVDADGNPVGPFFQCIAVSTSPDPTSTYFRYGFQISDTKINDYPKFGVWPDGYYLSVNQYDVSAGGTFAGVGVAAFERDKMLQGLSAQMIFFDLAPADPRFYGLLPSDLDGAPPPTGTPHMFAAFAETPNDHLNLWEFRVDFSTPGASTFGVNGHPNTMLNTAPFSTNFGQLCVAFFHCVPQPETRIRVDTIADFLMFRLQYRFFGTHQALVANHTVNAGTRLAPKAGIRWYELRNPGSGWGIVQQGTYAPDGDARWMGSIAMDRDGNLAVGYSVSGATTFPSIRYAGRLATDAPGTLPQAETELLAGGGSQTHPARRWGDYSMLAVDPTDDCTFWYTQEYYAATSDLDWQTRIGSFKFAECTAP
jgi:hypothetical protein